MFLELLVAAAVMYFCFLATAISRRGLQLQRAAKLPSTALVVVGKAVVAAFVATATIPLGVIFVMALYLFREVSKVGDFVDTCAASVAGTATETRLSEGEVRTLWLTEMTDSIEGLPPEGVVALETAIKARMANGDYNSVKLAVPLAVVRDEANGG